MTRTERLIAAAVLAAALAAEAACSDDTSNSTMRCAQYSPETGQQSFVDVDAQATCPPPQTTYTYARPATSSLAGWYVINGMRRWGTLPPRNARPATPVEAEHAEAESEARAHSAASYSHASETSAHASFGESGAHGGGG